MGDVKDTELMVNYIKSLYPMAFIGAVGISAGRYDDKLELFNDTHSLTSH